MSLHQSGKLGDVEGARIVAWAVAAIFLIGQVAGEYDGRPQQEMAEEQRVQRMHSGEPNYSGNAELPINGLWFGPRLGRRRRSDTKLNPKIETLGEMLISPGFTSIATSGNEEKRQETTFTPRLGRELEEAITIGQLVRSLMRHIDEQSEDAKTREQQVPPNFPPRLGRNLGRLEYELHNLLQKLQL